MKKNIIDVNHYDTHLLSPCYPVLLRYDNKKFKSMEHLYNYMKALFFNDKETADKIATQPSWMSKRYSMEIKKFDKEIWNLNKFKIMVMIIYLRLNSDIHLNTVLKNINEGHIVVYFHPTNYTWGTGMSINNKHNNFQEKWKGKNMLGKAYMEAYLLYKTRK